MMAELSLFNRPRRHRAVSPMVRRSGGQCGPGPSDLAITSLYVGGTPHNGGSIAFSSSSITPTANSLLVIEWAASWDGTLSTFTPSDTFGDTGGGSWTQIGTLQNSSNYFYASAWYRRIGADPSAGHVTITGSAGSGEMRHELVVDQITGASATTPVPAGQAVENGASYSTTGSVSLASAPASTSLVWSGAVTAGVETPSVTTSGFTGLDLASDGNGDQTCATSYVIGSGPTTVAWTGLNAGQVNYLFAVEVAV